MATIKEILDNFNKTAKRFYPLRLATTWVVIDRTKDSHSGNSIVARDPNGEKITALVKLLNGASDVNS